MHHKVHNSFKLDLREESDSGKKGAEDASRKAFACSEPQETVRAVSDECESSKIRG